MGFVEIDQHREALKGKLRDLDILRKALIAELDAINLYQSQILTLENEEAKKVLAHIMNEEKEHAAELLCVIKLLDEEEAKQLEKYLKAGKVDKCAEEH